MRHLIRPPGRYRLGRHKILFSQQRCSGLFWALPGVAGAGVAKESPSKLVVNSVFKPASFSAGTALLSAPPLAVSGTSSLVAPAPGAAKSIWLLENATRQSNTGAAPGQMGLACSTKIHSQTLSVAEELRSTLASCRRPEDAGWCPCYDAAIAARCDLGLARICQPASFSRWRN